MARPFSTVGLLFALLTGRLCAAPPPPYADLPGLGLDAASAVAVDPVGAIYVVGDTSSLDFPVTTGAFQRTVRGGSFGYDTFVVKLAPGATRIEWATYVGGCEDESRPDVAVAGDGTVYVAGTTASPDFPTDPKQDLHGGSDAFLVSFDSAGTLRWARLFGGSAFDTASAVHVDTAGAIYLAGAIQNDELPTTPGAVQEKSGGDGDAFVMKLDRDGRTLWATYLGGSGNDFVGDLTTDAAGDVYVSGTTLSRDFPVTDGALLRSSPVTGEFGSSGFASKLSADGTSLRYSTYLPVDGAAALTVATDGSAWLTGDVFEMRNGLVGTPDALQPGSAGGIDAFVLQLDPSGASLPYATYLGGVFADDGYGIALDGGGGVLVAGHSSSNLAPAPPGGLGCGAFFLRIVPGMELPTYIAGFGDGQSCASARGVVVRDEVAYVVGDLLSGGLAVSPDAPVRHFGSPGEAFLALLDAQTGMPRGATYLGDGDAPRPGGVTPTDGATLECEVRAGDVAVELADRLLRCQRRRIASHGQFDLERCTSRARARYDRAMAGLVRCPACVAAQAAGLAVDLGTVVARAAGEVWRSGSTALPDGGPGWLPPSTRVKRCESVLARILTKSISAGLACRTRAARASLTDRQFDLSSCEFRVSTPSNRSLRRCPQCLRIARGAMGTRGRSIGRMIARHLLCAGDPA